MGAAVGLGVGLGLLLCWSAFALPPSTSVSSVQRARRSRVEIALRAAGFTRARQGPFLALCAASGLSAALVVGVVSATLPVAMIFGVMASYLPVAVVAGRARRRQRELADVWPEAVDNLASAVRAGMALPEAIAALAERGPEPLRPAFAEFSIDFHVSGRFGDALDRLKERLADPVGDRVVEGLRIAREVGGGELGRLLRHLSAYLREEARTRSELEARQAWTVNGARLAVSAPWLVLLMMSFQSQVIRRYSTPGGVVILVIGAVLCVVAYQAMMRIGRLPVEERILA